MSVVAISALHRPLENLVMERRIELVLYFAVATYAQLRLAYLQHVESREAGLLGVGSAHKGIRTGNVLVRRFAVC